MALTRATTPRTFERCMTRAAAWRCSRPTPSTAWPATPSRAEAVAAPLRAQGPRPAGKPAAVMFFDRELALAALPELGRAHARRAGAPAARARSRCWCPIPTAASRSRAARTPTRSGCGCPRLPAARARRGALAGAAVQREPGGRPGRPAPRATSPSHPREAADLLLDGGELPGTPSTVIDLRALRGATGLGASCAEGRRSPSRGGGRAPIASRSHDRPARRLLQPPARRRRSGDRRRRCAASSSASSARWR